MAVSLSAARTPAGVRVANEGPRLDMRAVLDARHMLGIANDVLITWTNGRGGRRKVGMHMHSDANGAHDIRLVRGQSSAETSRTLWHELEHARQSERFGRATFNRLYALDPWTFERGAEAREKEHERWPLVR